MICVITILMCRIVNFARGKIWAENIVVSYRNRAKVYDSLRV